MVLSRIITPRVYRASACQMGQMGLKSGLVGLNGLACPIRQFECQGEGNAGSGWPGISLQAQAPQSVVGVLLIPAVVGRIAGDVVSERVGRRWWTAGMVIAVRDGLPLPRPGGRLRVP